MCGEKLIDTARVAEIFGVPERTVRVWRTKDGMGPSWAKFGRHVKYRESDVTAFIDDRYQAAADARASRDPR
jgi:DNA-binding transcriptional MerR regulator